jgi:hypothetical protein
MAAQHGRPHRAPLKPRLLVRFQWKREATVDVTHHASIVQQPDDLSIE